MSEEHTKVVEAPDRIWLTPQFAESADAIGGGIYHVNLSEEDRKGCVEYVRASPVAPSPTPEQKICAWCKETITTMYFGSDGRRYCSVNCQLQYEAETRRAGVNWESPAAPPSTQPSARDEHAFEPIDNLPGFCVHCGWSKDDCERTAARPIANPEEIDAVRKSD